MKTSGNMKLGRLLFSYLENLPWIDFFQTESIADLTISHWQALVTLYRETCWLLPFEKTCIVFERPNKISFDDRDRIRVETIPVISFHDGYEIS
jgi:hypothetical protein